MSDQKYDIVVKQIEGQDWFSVEEVLNAIFMLKKRKNIATLHFRTENGSTYAGFADISSVNEALRKWPDSDRMVGAPKEYMLNEKWQRLMETMKEWACYKNHPERLYGCSICWNCGGKTAADSRDAADTDRTGAESNGGGAEKDLQKNVTKQEAMRKINHWCDDCPKAHALTCSGRDMRECAEKKAEYLKAAAAQVEKGERKSAPKKLFIERCIDRGTDEDEDDWSSTF